MRKVLRICQGTVPWHNVCVLPFIAYNISTIHFRLCCKSSSLVPTPYCSKRTFRQYDTFSLACARISAPIRVCSLQAVRRWILHNRSSVSPPLFLIYFKRPCITYMLCIFDGVSASPMLLAECHPLQGRPWWLYLF